MNRFTHLIRMGLAYKLRREELNYPPYMVSIEATNICNFKCKFCPQSDPEHASRRGRGQLSPESMKCFLDRVVQCGSSNPNVSICLDGEPTVNPNLPRLTGLINEYGFSPRFSSNGRLLDERLTDAIIEAGPFLASIDFASDAKYFDEIRGRSGDFDRVLKNLHYLIEKARRNRAIRLEVVDTSVFSGADEKRSLQAMNKLLANGQDLPSNVKTWSREFHNFCGHMEKKDKGNYRLCAYPWSQFMSTWDGSVVACCRDTVGRTILGNVFEKPIMEIWNGQAYRQLRRCLANGKPEQARACSHCDMPYSGNSQRWRLRNMLQSVLRR